MKNMLALLLFAISLPIAPVLEVEAALVQKLPKCALADGLPYYTGNTIALNSGCDGAAHFVAEGTGYAVSAESGDLAGSLTAFTDAAADNSSAIRIPAGQGHGFLSGQARFLTPVLGAGDHYAWVRMRTPDTTATSIWMSTAPLLLIPSPANSLKTNVGTQALNFGWMKLTNVIAGGAAREVYVSAEPGIELDCIYIDALVNPPPASIRCQGGTSPAGAEYTMLRTTGTPASCADISTANSIPFVGFTNWNNTLVTAKTVWKDTGPPDRIFGCVKVNDANLNAPLATPDTGASFTPNNDSFELAIKSNTDNLNDASKTTLSININATPAIADFRTTATGTNDFTYNANCTAVRTIVGDLDAVADDTSWELFFACDLNGNDIAQSQLGKMNIMIRDNDGVVGQGTKSIAKGSELEIALPSAMMTVLFDSATIPPPSDVTAPTVGTPTLLVNGSNQQTWRFTCSDAGSGCASGVLDWDTNSGFPYANATSGTLAGGNFDVVITGLTPSTPYFVRGRPCDAAGNCNNNGAEANAVTSAATIYWASATGSDIISCAAVQGTIDPGVYRTLAGIFSCLAGGNTAMLKAGTYNYSVTNPAIPDGASVANPTKIHCEVFASPPMCILKPIGGAAADSIIKFNGATKSNIEFRGLSFDARSMTDPHSAFRTSGGSLTNVWVRNCEAIGKGVLVGNSFAAFILGSTVNGGGVSNCHIYNWGMVGGQPGSHGAYIQGNAITVEYSHIHDVDGLGVQIREPGGTGANNVVQYNRIHHTSKSGVLCGTGLTLSKCHNNIIYVTGSNGISTSDGVDSEIWNNTIYKAGTNGINITASTALVRNNIVLGSGTANISGTTAETGTNLTVNPGFVSLLTGCETTNTCNFALTAAATTAINAGVPTGITNILFNGSAPDIGAFETFLCPSATVGPGNIMDVTCSMAINTPVLPATAMTGWTVNNGRTVNSAVRLSNTVVRLTFSGAACTSGQTWTYSYASSGNVKDSSDIGKAEGAAGTGSSQQLSSITATTATNAC